MKKKTYNNGQISAVQDDNRQISAIQDNLIDTMIREIEEENSRSNYDAGEGLSNYFEEYQHMTSVYDSLQMSEISTQSNVIETDHMAHLENDPMALTGPAPDQPKATADDEILGRVEEPVFLYPKEFYNVTKNGRFLKPLAVIIRAMIRNDKEGKCINSFLIASDPCILMLAYETIKSKPGNMVIGSDKTTLDGISVKWFHKTSKELRTQKFKFKLARRVEIPKRNGKMRPLGIAPPRDKIIQQSFRLVLEMILEPKFSNSSHGFRPKRGCHTALKEIRKWKNVP